MHVLRRMRAVKAAALALMALAAACGPMAQAATTPTTTTVAGPAGPVNYGTAVTYTATVTGNAPTGTVTFYDTTGPVGQTTTTALSALPVGAARPLGAPVGGMASATITISTIPAGTHTITANYSGDGVNSASSTAPLPAAQLVLTVNKLATATALVGSASPTTYGQAVNLSATVSAGSSPSGTVSFKNGATVIGVSPVTVATGVATMSTNLLPGGTNTITAVYSGDTNNLTSTSGTVTQVVNLVPTSMSIGASPNPAAYAQAVTISMNVAGTLPLTGTVRLSDGGITLATLSVGSTGNVSYTASTLSVGPHSLSATYSGDASHSGSATAVLPLTVTVASTTTTIAANPNPAKPGQPVTLTATVTGASATGSVNFSDGATQLGSAPLTGGTAKLTISSLASATHAIVATYPGDANYSSSMSSALNLVVSQPPIVLTSSQNPSAVGQSVTFSVSVSGANPTGTVSILDGALSLADAPLSGGIASYATSSLPAGDHQIVARYNGDANNPSGYSAAVTQTVGAVVPQTGYWLNPNEGGRGFNIEKRGNSLFMATFLYDASGRATWYGIGPGAMTGSTYTGTLDSYAGGQTLTGAYKSPAIAGSGGAVTINFTSPATATMTWPGGTIPLQRYDFGPGGAGAPPAAGTPEPGWWWAPAEGGRGYAIEIQGNSMFLAGYMYDAQGNPVWYASGPAAMTNAMTYVGVWQEYGNGQTLTGAWHLPQITNSNAGNVTIQFSTTTTGTLVFPDGRQVAIQRFVF